MDLVNQERSLQPQLGCRKLLSLISEDLSEAGVSIGRDRFFDLMGKFNKLIKPKRRSVSTTNSRHRFRVYSNKLKDMNLQGPNEAIVSDITYIRTDQGFVYLALVMDAFSRKVIGYDCSDSLEAEGCLRALNRALKQIPTSAKAVHHSDRGCQYCCNAYIDMLQEAGIGISMTEDKHCYENAKAERLNGIMKHEYGLCNTFAKKEHAYEAVKQAVLLYNTRRPHAALGYRIPEAVHLAA